MIPAAVIAAAILAGLWLASPPEHRRKIPPHLRCRCCGVGRIEHLTICAACFASALVETEETL